MTRSACPGEPAEELACRHLARRGYEVLARNFRCRVGEIDIVAKSGELIAFIEVKHRTESSHGEGHEAVTAAKRRRIIAAAQIFAGRFGLGERALRFDVISVQGSPESPRLRHDEGAFDADGR